MTQSVLEHILYGLSIRHYKDALEPISKELPVHRTSKSAISQRFAQTTRKGLEELLNRPLGRKRFLALVIDGIESAVHTLVSALGITDGTCLGCLGGGQEFGQSAYPRDA